MSAIVPRPASSTKLMSLFVAATNLPHWRATAPCTCYLCRSRLAHTHTLFHRHVREDCAFTPASCPCRHCTNWDLHAHANLPLSSLSALVLLFHVSFFDPRSYIVPAQRRVSKPLFASTTSYNLPQNTGPAPVLCFLSMLLPRLASGPHSSTDIPRDTVWPFPWLSASLMLINTKPMPFPWPAPRES